jgi:methionine synthase II (cobalamin-independent)
MIVPARFCTTLVGSVPHAESPALCQRLAATLDMPAWPQLPRRTFRENMYTQFSVGLPGLSVDESRQRVWFDTNADLSPTVEAFYERYLAQDVESFAVHPDYAEGFYAMLDTLRSVPGEWVKGQVTGPISFGLTVTDQALRASLYNDMLVDVIVKHIAMTARWQVRYLRAARPNVILFVDEPYMASFGSAFISLSREQVTAMLDEVFAAIHEEGGLAGVHCCGNTDWSVLLATSVDVLNLDAYSHMDTLALYPDELGVFLNSGGLVAWGIVPNNEEIASVSAPELAQRLRRGLDDISRKAQARGVLISTDTLIERSIITPSCGLGSTTVALAEQVFEKVVDTASVLRRG